MTNKEIINRNIGLTFDLIRKIIENPDLADKIPDNRCQNGRRLRNRHNDQREIGTEINDFKEKPHGFKSCFGLTSRSVRPGTDKSLYCTEDDSNSS